MSQEQTTAPKSSGLVNILIGLAAYSAVGLLVGLLWNYAAPALGAPTLGILAMLALWWAFMFVVCTPIVFFVTVFRATDPLALAMRKHSDGRSPQDG